MTRITTIAIVALLAAFVWLAVRANDALDRRRRDQIIRRARGL